MGDVGYGVVDLGVGCLVTASLVVKGLKFLVEDDGGVSGLAVGSRKRDGRRKLPG